MGRLGNRLKGVKSHGLVGKVTHASSQAFLSFFKSIGSQCHYVRIVASLPYKSADLASIEILNVLDLGVRALLAFACPKISNQCQKRVLVPSRPLFHLLLLARGHSPIFSDSLPATTERFTLNGFTASLPGDSTYHLRQQGYSMNKPGAHPSEDTESHRSPLASWPIEDGPLRTKGPFEATL